MKNLCTIFTAMFILMLTMYVSVSAEGFVKKADQSGVTVVSYDDKVSADLIIAQYDDGGRLKSVKSCQIPMSSGENSYDYSTLGFGDEIPEGAKVMLWETGEIKPISSEYGAETVIRTDIVTKSLQLYRTVVSDDSGYKIQFYNDNTKNKYTTYKIAPKYEIYINGVEVKIDIYELYEILSDYNNVNVVLTDIQDKNGIYNGVYDRIDLIVYLTATVDYAEKADGGYYVLFGQSESDDIAELLIDEKSSDIEFKIYLGDKRVSASEIQTNDILSIMYDISGRFDDSSFYNICISRDIYEGKLRSVYNDEYTFENGEVYGLAYRNAARLERGNKYRLYFDIFGKIASADEIEEPVQFAILENVYKTNGGADYEVEIITPEAVKTYIIDENGFYGLKEVLMGDNGDYFNTEDKMEYRAPVQERVIEYRIKSNGEFSLCGILKYSDAIEYPYKAVTEKLATVKIYDTTSFIDLTKYISGGTAYKMSKDMLIDGGEYYAYNYEKRNGGIYNLVLVTSKPEGSVLGEEIVYVPVEEEKIEIPSEGLAILENVYTTNDGADYVATLITTVGKVTYLVDSDDYDSLKSILMGENEDMFNDEDKMKYRDYVSNRVIEYEVNVNDELNIRGREKYEVAFDGVYKASTGELAGNRVSEGITSFIDVQEYIQNGNDAVIMDFSELKNDTCYQGYIYANTGTDNVAQLVLITDGTVGLNVNDSMAVYVSSYVVYTDDGEMDAISAYVDGELTTLLTDVSFGLATGDVFFYTKNRDGYVTRIIPVLNDSISSTYGTFYADTLDAKFNLLDADVAAGFAGKDNKIKFSRCYADDCELAFGAVVDYVLGEISLAVYDENLDVNNFNIDDAAAYNLASDANVYIYDYEYSKIKNRVDITSASVFNYTIPEAAFAGASQGEVIDFTSNTLIDGYWYNDNYGKIRLALLKVVDDEVQEAIVYVPSSSKD